MFYFSLELLGLQSFKIYKKGEFMKYLSLQRKKLEDLKSEYEKNPSLYKILLIRLREDSRLN